MSKMGMRRIIIVVVLTLGKRCFRDVGRGGELDVLYEVSRKRP